MQIKPTPTHNAAWVRFQSSASGLLTLAIHSWQWPQQKFCDVDKHCPTRFEISISEEDSSQKLQYKTVKKFPRMNAILFKEKIDQLPNPVQYKVVNTEKKVSIKLTAYKVDSNGMETKILSDKHEIVKLRHGTGKIGIAMSSFTISYMFRCNKGYVDPQCKIKCQPKFFTSAEDSRRYACNSVGKKICLKGWIDANHDCLEPNPCKGVSCANGGVCQTNLFEAVCSCPAGFGGELCQHRVTACVQPLKCQNGGVCETINSREVCRCRQDFGGDLCQPVQIKKCQSDNCKNGATCSEVLGGFTCTCPPGFTGPLCAEDVDECARSPSACLNGGTCSNTIGSFRCTCPKVFHGSRCQSVLDGCAGPNRLQCRSGEQCFNTPSGSICLPGDGDDCVGEPCMNGGICRDLVRRFSCTCAPGFAGPTCAEVV